MFVFSSEQTAVISPYSTN